MSHTCTDACGITPDPGCPLWVEPVYPRGSPEWLVRCSALERREYDLGRDLVRLIRANRELLVPVLVELLTEELVEVIRETIARELGTLP